VTSYTLLYPKALFFPGVYLVHSHDRFTNKLLSPPYSQEENLFFSPAQLLNSDEMDLTPRAHLEDELSLQPPCKRFISPCFYFFYSSPRSGTSGSILGLPMCLLVYDLLLLYIVQKRILE